MEFVRMVQFTRLVKADGRLREFNFRKLKSPEAELFSVNVCNERGDRFFFSMQKKDTQWSIVTTPLPDWIVRNERSLNEAIEDELQSQP